MITTSSSVKRVCLLRPVRDRKSFPARRGAYGAKQLVSRQHEHGVDGPLGLPRLHTRLRYFRDLLNLARRELLSQRAESEDRSGELLCQLFHSLEVFLLKFVVAFTFGEQNPVLALSLYDVLPHQSEIRFQLRARGHVFGRKAQNWSCLKRMVVLKKI
jgi:hypothetical protein